MALKAKLFIGVTIAAGSLVVAGAAAHIQSFAPLHAILLLLALLCAACKVRIPGVSGTYSLGFMPTLIGIAGRCGPEICIVAAFGGVVQCLWRPAKPAAAAQTAFSGAALAISAAAAHALFTSATAGGGDILVPLTAAAALYYALNSGLVAAVVAVVTDGFFRQLWQRWCIWSFPFYLAGSGLAALASATVRRDDWLSALLIMPISGLLFVCYRLWVERSAARGHDG